MRWENGWLSTSDLPLDQGLSGCHKAQGPRSENQVPRPALRSPRAGDQIVEVHPQRRSQLLERRNGASFAAALDVDDLDAVDARAVRQFRLGKPILVALGGAIVGIRYFYREK